MRLQHEIDKTQWIEILLQPRSLYVIRLYEFRIKDLNDFDVIVIFCPYRSELRYHFTHEVLLDPSSYSNPFELTDSPSRRVSLIVRSQPQRTS
jgi:hypothetical protein